MTHVDWHPVTVNENSEIVSGDIPEEDCFVWITTKEKHCEPSVERVYFGDGIPTGSYVPFRFWNVDDGRIIIAWAYCEEPKPYRPEVKDDES